MYDNEDTLTFSFREPCYQVKELKITYTHSRSCINTSIGIGRFDCFVEHERDINFKRVKEISISMDGLHEITGLLRLTSLREMKLYYIPHIPHEVLTCTTLISLTVTALEKVPPCISQLGNLTSLKIKNGCFASVPDSLGLLTNLVKLNLSGNGLLDLPSSLSRLTSLEQVNLTHNKLTYLPNELSTLTGLSELKIYHNDFGEPPDVLQYFTRLTTLDLICCNLKTLPSCITTLTNLRCLDFKGNHLLTRLPIGLSSLTKLRYISFDFYICQEKRIENVDRAFYVFHGNISFLDQGVNWSPYLSSLDYTPVFTNKGQKETVMTSIKCFNRLLIPRHIQMIIFSYLLPRRYPLSVIKKRVKRFNEKTYFKAFYNEDADDKSYCGKDDEESDDEKSSGSSSD